MIFFENDFVGYQDVFGVENDTEEAERKKCWGVQGAKIGDGSVNKQVTLEILVIHCCTVYGTNNKKYERN